MYIEYILSESEDHIGFTIIYCYEHSSSFRSEEPESFSNLLFLSKYIVMLLC